jgi:hypothetical protein
MNAIMGKIVSVSAQAGRRGKQRGIIPVKVRFKAVARLPERADVPAWLVDQVLTVQREVADVREIGGTGDAIALTPGESEKWLAPLTVEPATIDGKLPTALRLSLRWWKTATPPEFAVKALGKTITGTFSRRGESFYALVRLSDLIDEDARRPIEIEITCESLRAVCAVVPASKPAFHRFIDIRGEGYRLLNGFYSIDIVANQAGGAIIGFRERGRGVDHFARTSETQKALDKAGHSDRVWVGGQDKLPEAKLAFTIRQHESGGTRVEIDGIIDEGKNVRSAATYRLLDGLPLLVLRRDARIGEAKPDEKKEKPKEPTDSLVPLQLGFRHATTVEGDGVWGGQIISADGDRLAAVRACFENDHSQRGEWTLKSGWAMVHHPLRREVTLLLVDPEHPPEFLSWAGSGFITVEPNWFPRPYRPPAGAAFTIAMSAGETGGASIDGAWVACRGRSDGKGFWCLAIARLRSPAPNAGAEFRLGKYKVSASLGVHAVEGVGDVHFAAVYFPDKHKSHDLDAVVAGIPRWSKP